MRLVPDRGVQPPRRGVAKQLRQEQRGRRAAFDRRAERRIDIGEQFRILERARRAVAYEIGANPLPHTTLQLRHPLLDGHLIVAWQDKAILPAIRSRRWRPPVPRSSSSWRTRPDPSV